MFIPWLLEVFRSTVVLIMEVSFWVVVAYIVCRIGAKAIARSVIEEITTKFKPEK